jgi:hypothetical protein
MEGRRDRGTEGRREKGSKKGGWKEEGGWRVEGGEREKSVLTTIRESVTDISEVFSAFTYHAKKQVSTFFGKKGQSLEKVSLIFSEIILNLENSNQKKSESVLSPKSPGGFPSRVM